MQKIIINEREYEVEKLPDDAKHNLQMLKITEQEAQRLQTSLAITLTARNSYANALRIALSEAEKNEASY